MIWRGGFYCYLGRGEVLCEQIIVGHTAKACPVGSVEVHAVDCDVGGDGLRAEGGVHVLVDADDEATHCC